MSAPKRPRGRPPISGETGQRYQVHLPPTVAEKLRKHGDGSLSQGIVRAAKKVRDDVPKPSNYGKGRTRF